MIWTELLFSQVLNQLDWGGINMAKNEAKTQETLELFESYNAEEIEAQRELFTSSSLSSSSS